MKLDKVKVESKTRALSAKYTVEQSEEIEHILGDELQKEIDNEVMNSILGPTLRERGWYPIVLKDTYWADIPKEWIAGNIQYKYSCFGSYWYFENQADATAFALKWT
jgi:hypothetical protein